ncbi:MAG: hypothetical protein KKH12_11280 [Gammaproteobacteria bacterium]|nr:hypothetical protein [Gammaproteobacteria bacterium]MBU1482240.1 hypothetical protein [Gammaproteobacteria bacterium]
MRNYKIVILAILLSGCVAPYSYKSISNNDPEIVFGERMGDVGNRGFNVKVNDISARDCKDFTNVGVVSNNNKYFDKTKTIRTPAGKAIAIRSYLTFAGATCQPGVKMFTPKTDGKYSVDIGLTGNICFLSIAEIDRSGKIEEVKEYTVLPECNKF